MILLDTCALIWYMRDAPISPRVLPLMDRCALSGELYISPISAWEIGTLVRRGRLHLDQPAAQWVAQVFERPDVQIAQLTPTIAIRSCLLPGEFHAGPADRFLMATAIEMGLRFVTRDQHILDYGKQGYASVLVC